MVATYLAYLYLPKVVDGLLSYPVLAKYSTHNPS